MSDNEQNEGKGIIVLKKALFLGLILPTANFERKF